MVREETRGETGAWGGSFGRMAIGLGRWVKAGMSRWW